MSRVEKWPTEHHQRSREEAEYIVLRPSTSYLGLSPLIPKESSVVREAGSAVKTNDRCHMFQSTWPHGP